MAFSICKSLAKNNVLINASVKPLFTRFLSLQVQKPAPEFKGQAVIDGSFKEVKLSDYKGKYLYLFFYPLDFAKAFKDLNTELVACSVDSHFSHLAWANIPRKQGGLGFEKGHIPLLSDLSKQISKDYNVLLENGISLRGSFLIDTNGILRHVTINDLPVGRSVEEALRVIKAFQFFEKHGEVCPANWQPNKPTINPSNANEYFSKNN